MSKALKPKKGPLFFYINSGKLDEALYEALKSCSDPNWATRSWWKKKIEQNLLQSKHAGLTSFRWPVVLIDHNFFPTIALGNASGFSYQWTNSSYTG